MASNVTQHYQLCQWEPGDKVERLDFNEDNEKIDTAIKAAADVAGAAQNLAQLAYSPTNEPVVIGSYTGDGTERRTISLGFTPRAVYVCGFDGATHTRGTSHNYYGGLALPGQNVAKSESGVAKWVPGDSALGIVEGGFQVTYFASSTTFFCLTNENNHSYRYIAIK